MHMHRDSSCTLRFVGVMLRLLLRVIIRAREPEKRESRNGQGSEGVRHPRRIVKGLSGDWEMNVWRKRGLSWALVSEINTKNRAEEGVLDLFGT